MHKMKQNGKSCSVRTFYNLHRVQMIGYQAKLKDIPFNLERKNGLTGLWNRGELKQRFVFGFVLTGQIFIKKGQNSQFVRIKINFKVSKITFA